MQKLFSAFGLFLLATQPAIAEENQNDLSHCIKTESDLDRLSCYDKASGRTPSTQQSTNGAWGIQTEISKLTDKKSVFLSVQSDEVINCGWNKGEKIVLQVRCYENATDLFFVTNCHMASGSYTSYGDIEYRIDAEKSQKVDGVASTDNKALGMWGGTRSIPVIKQMIGKQKMVVRMTPYSESPFTATFNISGLDETIKPLRKECGW